MIIIHFSLVSFFPQPPAMVSRGSIGWTAAAAAAILCLLQVSSAEPQFFSFARDTNTNGCPPVTEKHISECTGMLTEK